MIAGLLGPDEGRVLFGETDATRLSLRERNVGFVFQHYALFRHMTVAENIAFGLQPPAFPAPGQGDDREARAGLLQFIQLPEHGERYPEQLSGGQKQRVALARRSRSIRACCCWTTIRCARCEGARRTRRWLRRLHEQTGRDHVVRHP